MPPSKPTKLVLLMSAAGLGLALPALAAASQASSEAALAPQSCRPGELPDLRDCRIGLVVGGTDDAGITVRVLSAPTGDSPDFEKVSRAIAMIVMADPSTVLAGTAAPAPAGQVRTGQAAGARAHPAAAVPGTLVLAVQSNGAVARKAEGRAEVAAPIEVSRHPAGAQGAGEAAPAATLSAPATDLDRTLASLAEVLGASIDTQAAGDETPVIRASAVAADAPSAADHITTTADARGFRLAEGDAAAHRDWLVRLMQAHDIEVASHADIVLIDLGSIRFDLKPGDLGLSSSLGAQPVVATEEDKVLQTLAFVRSSSDQSRDEANARRSGRKAGAAARPDSAGPAAAAASEADKVLDVLALVRGSADAAHAGDAQPHDGDRHSRSPLGDELVAVRTDKLEEVRGGFVTDGGLKVSFGIERAVYINGDLVATTTLNVGDLSRTAATGTAPAANAAAQAATGTLALIQTGPGNSFTTAPIGADALGTVIQNRLDNQQITAITRINAAVNSASIMRSLNLQSSLRSATIDALRR